jgi:hypothetical protein
MTEILTESFCERCGTRYTFESARPRTRLKGVKVLSRGLKNFVLSDDTSIDEAMAAARSETDREATSHQLDAFHKTFNFCMSCRQYTCPNCWNEAEARCLSCAPLALVEPATTIDDLRALRDAVVIDEPAWTHGQPVPAEESSSVPGQPEAGTWAAEAADAIEADATTVDGTPLEPAASPAADKAAAQTTGLLRRFRPGQSLDAELDAYERELADAQTTAKPGAIEELDAESFAAAATEPEPDQRSSTAEPDALGEPAEAASTLAEPEPVAASDEPAIEAVVADEPTTEAVVVATAEPEPIAAAEAAEEPAVEAAEEPAALATEDEAELPAVAASGPPPEWTTGADVVEQPTWRIKTPEAGAAMPPPAHEPDVGAVPLQANGAPSDGASVEPQWPARPQWPAASGPAAGLPFLGRSATPQGGIEALWAASNQEIVTAPPAPGRQASGIQPCVSCGLSLSATARFCRRCGTLQDR